MLKLSQHCSVQFHWDCDDQRFKKLTEQIDAMLEKVACMGMVVVGYSFPHYNQRMDKIIFDLLKEKVQMRGSLSFKIYIQDPKAEEVAKRVIQQFGLSEENHRTNH